MEYTRKTEHPVTENDTPLSDSDAERYGRHLILPEIGVSGQEKLRASRVLVVGAGGLGSPAALYLAAAGVGTIGLADGDVVDLSNLQRQILHGETTLGSPKTSSAAERLRNLNSGVMVETYQSRLGERDLEKIAAEYDVLLGCVDDFPSRYDINAACVERGKPNVFGSASMFHGQLSVFPAGGKPCYRCFFQEPPPPDRTPHPAERGVASMLPGVIGCLQAAEALKILLGIGSPMYGRLLLYDMLSAGFREIPLRANPDCPVCSKAG